MTASGSLVCRVDRPDAPTIRLALAGSLTHETADEVLRHVTDGLAALPRTRAVVLDCADVDLCDSHGLSVLLLVRRATTAARVDLRLDALPRHLVRILQITGTLAYLTAVPSRRQRHAVDGRHVVGVDEDGTTASRSRDLDTPPRSADDRVDRPGGVDDLDARVDQVCHQIDEHFARIGRRPSDGVGGAGGPTGRTGLSRP